MFEALDLGRGVQRSGAILAIPTLSGLRHHSYNCPPLLMALLLVSPSPKPSRLRLVLVSTVSRRSAVSWSCASWCHTRAQTGGDGECCVFAEPHSSYGALGRIGAISSAATRCAATRTRNQPKTTNL
jgi:hypothetical protein